MRFIRNIQQNNLSSYFFFNTLNAYTVLEVRLDQSPYQRIGLSNAATITFTGVASGFHIVRFRLRNASRTDYYSAQASFNFVSTTLGSDPGPISTDGIGIGPQIMPKVWNRRFLNISTDTIFRSATTWKSYDETSGKFGTVEVRLIRGKNIGRRNPVFHKPMIIVDGFDPGDTRKIDKVGDKDGILQRLMYDSTSKIDTFLLSVGDMQPIFNKLSFCRESFLFLNYKSDLPNYNVFRKSNMNWFSNHGYAYTEPVVYEIPEYVGTEFDFPFLPVQYLMDTMIIYGSVIDHYIPGPGPGLVPCLNVVSRHVITRKSWCIDPTQPSGDSYLSATAYPNLLNGQKSFRLSIQNIDLPANPTYTIADNYGRIWQSGKIDKAEMEISVVGFPEVSALYQLNIHSGKQRTFTRIGIVR